jgi:AraC-like DNA-binding protein
MVSRRRIDWEVLLSPGAFAPEWGNRPNPSDLVSALISFQELFQIEDTDNMLKRTVELAIGAIGLERAGLYLYDESLDLMLGTWGTNIRREVVDEHYAMFESGDMGQRVFTRSFSNEAHWTVVEDCPIIDQSERDTKIIGKGWVVCTPIRSASRPLGMLYNDAGLTNAEVEPTKQLHAAILCAVVGAVISNPRHPDRTGHQLIATAKHATVTKITAMLDNDPSLSGKTMAKKVGISLSRLARLFKSEIGLSLVEYRNRLRLERFFGLVDSGNNNLLEAALASGFGSYAQFHRVFCNVYKARPRDFLLTRKHAPLTHK